MVWAKEVLQAKFAKSVEDQRSKDFKKMIEKRRSVLIRYKDVKITKKDIECEIETIQSLMKEGFLKELPDRYVMTEKASKICRDGEEAQKKNPKSYIRI